MNSPSLTFTSATHPWSRPLFTRQQAPAANRTNQGTADRSTCAFDARAEAARVETPVATVGFPPDTHTSSHRPARAGETPATDADQRQGPRNQPSTYSHQNWSQLTRLASNENRKPPRARTVRRNRPTPRGNPQRLDPSQTARTPDCSPTSGTCGTRAQTLGLGGLLLCPKHSDFATWRNFRRGCV